MKSKMKESPRRDQYTVVLEGLRSDFKVFGESLDAVRDEVKDNSHKLLKVEAEIVEMKQEIVEIKGDLEIMKTELALIRHNLITRDEFKFLETRIQHLEKAISHH